MTTSLPYIKLFTLQLLLCISIIIAGCDECQVDTGEDTISDDEYGEQMDYISGMNCEPAANAEMIMPKHALQEQIVPIVVRVRQPDLDAIDISIDGYANILSDGAPVGSKHLKLSKGVGTILYKMPKHDKFTFMIQHDRVSSCYREELNTVKVARMLSGVLTGSELAWKKDDIIQIDSHVVIPHNSTLNVEEGVSVLMGHNSKIIVQGGITIDGTRDDPVLITSVESSKPWGQISHEQDSVGEYAYVLITNGGGDAGMASGHSNSQPVIKMDRSKVDFDNVFILDNPGKAMESNYAYIIIKDSIISRNDTGGEHHRSYLHISNSYFLDIPSDDGIYVDDDNDAIYLSDSYEDDAGRLMQSVIEKTYFINGKDDGLDHTGAYVLVDGCWFEGFMHEGVAASFKNEITIRDSVITNNQQGIEAGHGSPDVVVDHSLIFGNAVGVRFGDPYGQGSDGKIAVTNSIIADNKAYNVLDWVWTDAITPNDGLELVLPNDQNSSDGYPSDRISIGYSVINDGSFNKCSHCQYGTPVFNDTYHLIEDSVGRSIGNDSMDAGLLSDSNI